MTIYLSITLAAKALDVHQSSISLYLQEGRTKPFDPQGKGKYIFNIIKGGSTSF